MTLNDNLCEAIGAKKAALDAIRPLREAQIAQLRKYYDVELTYSSNAIEGNELTARETAEVIEHGITIAGKRLRDHLEALDHYDAVQWMHDLAARGAPLKEGVVTELHRRIVARSQPAIAGAYSSLPRRILGSAVVFPNAAKVPELMANLGAWLEGVEPDFDAAFAAHLKLVSIHPFSDGNGRTARLLMNVLLLRSGYVPVSVRPEDRAGCLDVIETAQLTGDEAPYRLLMLRRLDETLADYLSALGQTP